MLAFLNILQLLMYIAGMALLGQGVLYVLAGPSRESNLFYGLLRVIAKPFTVPVRALTPARVADRHVPILTFALLLPLYALVTIEKIRWCVDAGLHLCR